MSLRPTRSLTKKAPSLDGAFYFTFAIEWEA